MGKTRHVLALSLGILLLAPLAVQAQVIQQAASRTGQPAIASSLVIEQFLRAVNANDFGAMAKLFGTREGPVSERDPRAENEQRMFALASILRHDDYRLDAAEVVPGRSEEATLVRVRMTIRQRPVLVPFTLVRTKRDAWLVEQIGIEGITSNR